MLHHYSAHVEPWYYMRQTAVMSEIYSQTSNSYNLCDFGVYAAMGLQTFILLGQHSLIKLNVSRECNVLLFRGCMSQKSARNKRMKGSYSNSVTSDCLEKLTDRRGSNGRGICTVLLLEWARWWWINLLFLANPPPHILVDVSWCPPSPTTHVLCNSPHLILLFRSLSNITL